MAQRYLGGSGESLTVWISLAASTVLIFYGYDQASMMRLRSATSLILDRVSLETSLFLKISLELLVTPMPGNKAQ